MKPTWTRRGISLAIAFALVLLFSTLAHCQNKQATITDSCSIRPIKCGSVFGRMSASKDMVFFRLQGEQQEAYKVISSVEFRHYSFYRIYDSTKYIGMVWWCDTSAVIECYDFNTGHWKTNRYIFNKTRFE